MRWTGIGLGILVASCVVSTSFAQRAERVVDGVLATIDRTPILRSDLALARIVGLAEGTERSLLDARMRLELQFRDLADSDAFRRLEIDVPGRIEELIQRHGDRPALVSDLEAAGLDWDDLEALALRMEVARAWTREHLLPRVVVTLEEVEDAYRRVIVRPALDQGAEPPPLARVHEQVRQVVEQEKLNQEIERWVENSRERHEIVRFVR